MRPFAPLLVYLVAFSPMAFAQTVSVSGAANIFAAGAVVPPPDLACSATPNGELPVEIDVPAGATSFTVGNASVSALSCAVGSFNSSADGPCLPGNPTSIPASGGISGIVDAGDNMFVIGVFLGPSDPTSTAPATLDFSGNESFATLSPQLQQTFFIGDGLTGGGSGTAQHFVVPAGATRLFLGFADAFAYQGPNGCYQDNGGAANLTVNFARPLAVTPTPALSRIGAILLGAMLALAAALFAARRMRG
jgi:hypothetical protein